MGFTKVPCNIDKMRMCEYNISIRLGQEAYDALAIFFRELQSMKEYKTFNQQLTILRNRGMIVPQNGAPKRFLEQENYYNVINGYKDIFLTKDAQGNPIKPEAYIQNTHFDELKALFLFDRELRFLFLKYLLIFENSFKTVISHEFSRKYPKANSYPDIANYRDDDPKSVLKQISILTKTIHENVGAKGAIKHYYRRTWISSVMGFGKLSYNWQFVISIYSIKKFR